MRQNKSPTLNGYRVITLSKEIGLGGGPEDGNFPLLYVMKMSLRRGVGGSKRPQTPLHNKKMVPNNVAVLLLLLCERMEGDQGSNSDLHI